MLYNDLIQIRNAYLAKLPQVLLPYSKLVFNVLKVLKQGRYVGSVKVVGEDPKKKIEVDLLYTERVPHLHEIKFYSKPGKRMYLKKTALRKVRQGYGDLILSTSQGVMSVREAKRRKTGGEVICEVF